MNILVIDAQGGGIGRQLIPAIKDNFTDVHITAIGTNSAATTAMLKSGADQVATGENPILIGCERADVVIGPVGIVIANSMLGEITPDMAVAVGSCQAKKILIPVNQCENIVVGVPDLSMKKLIDQTVEQIKKLV